MINLLRDLENSLRDICKCDMNVSYFTFKKSTSTKTSNLTPPTTTTTTNTDEVFDEEQLFLKDTIKASESSRSYSASYYNDLHFIDEFDHDLDFIQLKKTKFVNLHNALSRSENLIITINAEYVIAPISTTGAVGACSAPSLSQSMSSSINANSSTALSYNRVPSFGSAKDKEQQHLGKMELVTDLKSNLVNYT